MPGYGAFAYAELPYGGGEEPSTADGFSISDSLTRQPNGLSRNAADSWSIGDAVTGIYGFDPPAFDAFSISDSASDTRSLRRSASDSFTLHDAVVGVFTPYVDQPTPMALKPDGNLFFLQPGDAMSLDPAIGTLQLKSDRATNTLNPEAHGLTLEDDSGGLWADG